MISLPNILLVSLFLFSAGVVALLTRRNATGIVVGGVLLFNAVALNFVAFSRFVTNQLDGHVAALFVIVVSAVEFALFLAIMIKIFQFKKTLEVSEIQELRC